jgi:hypothetical protein
MIHTYIHAKHLKLTLGSDKQKLNTFLLLKAIGFSQFVMPRTDTFHSADFSYTVSITYSTHAILNLFAFQTAHPHFAAEH